MGDVVTGIIAFLNGFLAAPLGQSILVVVVVTIAGYYLRGWSKDRLTSQRLKSDEAKGKLDGEIRKMELENERKEDDRQALANAENRTLLAKLADTQSNIVTILQRLEVRQQSVEESSKDTKAGIEAVSIRAENIHRDVRSSAISLAGKLDGANNESRTRWENTQVVMNNRAQEIQKTVHSTANDITGKLNEQNSVLDQMLIRLGELSKEVTGLRGDFRENTKTQAAAVAHREDERFTSIQNSLRELTSGLLALKKRGTNPLDPKVVEAVPEPLARHTVAENVPLVSEALGIKRSTEPLPPPPPTIVPLTTPKEDA